MSLSVVANGVNRNVKRVVVVIYAVTVIAGWVCTVAIADVFPEANEKGEGTLWPHLRTAPARESGDPEIWRDYYVRL